MTAWTTTPAFPIVIRRCWTTNPNCYRRLIWLSFLRTPCKRRHSELIKTFCWYETPATTITSHMSVSEPGADRGPQAGSPLGVVDATRPTPPQAVRNKTHDP